MTKKYIMDSHDNDLFEHISNKINASTILNSLKMVFKLTQDKLVLDCFEPVSKNEQINIRKLQRSIEKKMLNFKMIA